MYVVFEREAPHLFSGFKTVVLNTNLSLKGYVMQIDSNLVVIKLNTLFLSVGTKSGCLRIQPIANVLEMFVTVASSFHEHSVKKPVGPLSISQ